MGRVDGYGVVNVSKDDSGRIMLTFNKNSTTTEISTHVSTKSLGKIKSPLDSLNLKKEVISDRICQQEDIFTQRRDIRIASTQPNWEYIRNTV